MIGTMSRLLSSTVCRTSHFYSEWYARRSTHLLTGQPLAGWQRPGLFKQLKENFYPPPLHRKYWEWAAIAEVLHQRKMLAAGRHGIGFAVGKEPLTSYFAARGATILATDLDTSAEDGHWSQTGQQAAALDHVRMQSLIDQETFVRRVSFQEVDMRQVDRLENSSADFLWSSCSFEHLGSLEAGLTFVERAMDLLKPGGVAVHTTEYNVTSNDETLREGWCVVYRKRDLEELTKRLAAKAQRWSRSIS